MNDSGFLIKSHGDQKEIVHFSCAEGKKRTINQEFHIRWKYPLGMKKKIKTFSHNEKLKESVTSILKIMVRENSLNIKDSDKRRDPEMTGRKKYRKSKYVTKNKRFRILFFSKLC